MITHRNGRRKSTDGARRQFQKEFNRGRAAFAELMGRSRGQDLTATPAATHFAAHLAALMDLVHFLDQQWNLYRAMVPEEIQDGVDEESVAILICDVQEGFSNMTRRLTFEPRLTRDDEYAEAAKIYPEGIDVLRSVVETIRNSPMPEVLPFAKGGAR